MTSIFQKPGRYFPFAIRAVGVVIIIFLLFLVYMAIHENRRHAQLESSINVLQANLKADGFNVQKTNGCGRPYSEFGSGDKSCSISLSSKRMTTNEQSAYGFLKSYTDIIHKTGSFEQLSSIPSRLVDKDSLAFGYITYIHKNTKRVCTADYDYKAKEKAIDIGFSCDDTSWFVKTFEG